MSASDLNVFSATLERLFKKEVFYSTVIDVGCADGHFFLNHMKLFPNAVPLNIDANRLYETSLKAIKDVVGGDYFIGAITDYIGEIDLTESVHPYWTSIRPEGDNYWSRINGAAAVDNGENMVPAILLAFRLTSGNCRSCLLERNRRAITGRRRWRRRRLLLCVNGASKQ